MYYQSKRYKGRGKTRVDWPGSFHKARAPDVLYSKAFWTFSCDERQFQGLDASGNPSGASINWSLPALRIAKDSCFSTNNSDTTPHWTSVNMNNPGTGPFVCSGRWKDDVGGNQDSTICRVTRNANLNAGPMNLNQWAAVYKYMAPYKAKVSVTFLPAVVQPGEADQPATDDLNADALIIYYMLPNRMIGECTSVNNSTDRAALANPYGWSTSRNTTNPSTIMQTSEVKYINLSSPNTIGGGTRISAVWSLRNQKERNVNYMLKNVSLSTGSGSSAAWTTPIDLTITNASVPSPAWWFSFALGTKIGYSQFSYATRYRVNVTYYYKCWELRTDITSWQALLSNVLVPPQDTPQDDDMDFEQLEQEEPYTSVPSTPVIEQLTRELAQFGNVQKRPPLKRT